MNIKLYRFQSPTKNHPTMGTLVIDGAPFLTTLELPWRGNQNNISCIPEGEYLCKKTENRKLLGSGDLILETFEVEGVKDRSGILFHWGNLMKNTRGCILVGLGFGSLAGQPAILESRKGFYKFLDKTKGLAQFSLEVLKV